MDFIEFLKMFNCRITVHGRMHMKGEVIPDGIYVKTDPEIEIIDGGLIGSTFGASTNFDIDEAMSDLAGNLSNKKLQIKKDFHVWSVFESPQFTYKKQRKKKIA